MKLIITLIYSLAMFMALSGCESGSTPNADAIMDEISQTLDGLKKQVGANEIDSLANQEVEKLFSFEYRVHEIPYTDNANEITAVLAVLGAERWDCFHVEETVKYIRLYCKRRPKTYLRYIPRVF